MNDNLIKVGNKICKNSDDDSKQLILDILEFLIKENEFNKIMNNEIKASPEQLINIGKELSLKQAFLMNETNKQENLKDIQLLKNRIRIIFMIKLRNLNFVPSNYWKTLTKVIFPNSYKTQKNDDFVKLFDNICDRYFLLETIYNINTLNGISIFLALNNKLKEKYGIELFDFNKNGFILLDTLLLITSTSSPISQYTIEKQVELLFDEYNNMQETKKK